MAQPAQIKTGLPSGEFVVIDNGASPVVITASGSPQITNGQTGLNTDKATLGFDTIAAPAAVAQGTNPFGGTGTVLVDASGNDTVYADPGCATFPGNPVSLTAPTFKTVTKVLTNPLSATVNFKNPA